MTHDIHKTGERGFAMVFSMFIVTLLLVLGLAMLSVSQYSSADTRNIESKQSAFDAAEAGINEAIDKIDASRTYAGNGVVGVMPTTSYTFTYTVVNNLANSQPTVASYPDAGGYAVNVPGNRALITSTGVGPHGERPTHVEAIVKDTQINVAFPNDAIDAGLDISGNWNTGVGIGVQGSSPGANDAIVHANHNITATIAFLQGTASASGTIDTLNNTTGGINTAQRQLPTSQMAQFVAAEKATVQAGGQYVMYIPSGGTIPSTYTCPSGAPAQGCTIFVDGPYLMSGQTTITFTGRVNLIINGNYTSIGNSAIHFQAAQKSLFVINGNADIGGNGTASALIWTLGNTTLHGNGFQLGSLVSGGNVIFKGGGSNGGFKYDKSYQNFTFAVPGTIVVSTFGEY
ncbi:MAG TPA: hypothetical protein VFF60_01025 [Candidatus Binatus sp.]|nr:hypothetical protein [Candidatus Binatus sp.]